MKIKSVAKLKEKALDSYLGKLTDLLQKEQDRGDDGVFDGKSYLDVLELDQLHATDHRSKVSYLEKLIETLDSLDEDDFFGTEGWRHYIMGED
jgi:hypothetical protein